MSCSSLLIRFNAILSFLVFFFRSCLFFVFLVSILSERERDRPRGARDLSIRNCVCRQRSGVGQVCGGKNGKREESNVSTGDGITSTPLSPRFRLPPVCR